MLFIPDRAVHGLWVAGVLENNCRTGDAEPRGLGTEKEDGEATIRDNSRDAKESTPVLTLLITQGAS